MTNVIKLPLENNNYSFVFCYTRFYIAIIFLAFEYANVEYFISTMAIKHEPSHNFCELKAVWPLMESILLLLKKNRQSYPQK